MSEGNAKTWAIDKTKEIKSIVDDMKYLNDKWLQQQAILHIDYLADRILEHLEYLDIKEVEENE